MFNNQKNKSLIAQGSQKKFRQLMELTADELLNFAMGFLRNKEVAEEIVSDVYVKIWNNRAEITKIHNLKSYLFICVKNGCLSYLRKIKNEKPMGVRKFLWVFFFIKMSDIKKKEIVFISEKRKRGEMFVKKKVKTSPWFIHKLML